MKLIKNNAMEISKTYNYCRHSESYIDVDWIILLDSISLYKNGETVILETEDIIDILHDLFFPDAGTTKKTWRLQKKGSQTNSRWSIPTKHGLRGFARSEGRKKKSAPRGKKQAR